MTKKKPTKPAEDPQVYKEHEYGVFLSLIAGGLWKNNSFIADVCGLDRETVAKWKNRDEVKKLRQESVKKDLVKWKNRSDPEQRLKEQGMDFEAEKLDVTMSIEVKGLENLK